VSNKGDVDVTTRSGAGEKSGGPVKSFVVKVFKSSLAFESICRSAHSTKAFTSSLISNIVFPACKQIFYEVTLKNVSTKETRDGNETESNLVLTRTRS